jgi:ABC-type nitrate/sulfonate/bicarbonate transport system substrate-binding protein
MHTKQGFSYRLVFLTVTISVVLTIATACSQVPLQSGEIVMVSPMTTFAWPTYIALQAGYYAKYGVNVKLVFSSHPADVAMLVSDQAQVDLNTLQQAMELGAKSSSIRMYGLPLKTWLFALMARENIHSVRELKGKRIGITQLGGSTYSYAVRLLAQFGMNQKEVNWISLGDNSRIAALTSRQVDATMLSAPSYFALEKTGYRSLANISDYENIHAANVMILKQSTIQKLPHLPSALIKAHAEAVKRFYEDKPFAIQAHLAYDRQNPADLEQVYDAYVARRAFHRVPYISADEVQFAINNPLDPDLSEQMRAVDYATLIDNGVLDKLVQDRFFERLFVEEVKGDERKDSSGLHPVSQTQSR